MSVIKRTAEHLIHRVLHARNVPEARWPELVKKTGRGLILLGVVSVLPLLIVDTMPLPVTIVLQICYACMMCLGVILAFEDKKSQGRS